MTKRLIRYVSPFGSPAWMSRERAERLLKEDDSRWLFYSEHDLLSDAQKAIGPPRIEKGEDK